MPPLLRLLCCLLLVAAGEARAQTAEAEPTRTAPGSAPLTLVNRETEVRAIRFRFTDTQTFSASELREHIALTARGRLHGLRRTLAFLPLLGAPGQHPFLPVELARDAVRIERFYQRNGFLFPEVDWLVRLDTARNVVTVLFTITEGEPLLIESLAYEAPDGTRARTQFPTALHPQWEAFRARSDLQAGERLDEFRLVQLREEALAWARNRGFAFARVRAQTRVDTLASRAHVLIRMDAGPQARVRSIEVEGNELVRDRVVRRELPFREGDLFSQRRLVAGQREVFGLNIFRIALAEVPEQPRDSTVAVRIRVREANPHAVSAQVGYLSNAGLTGRAEWTHRNFLGDARTFTATAVANTGLLALAEEPERLYRAGLSLRQPYVFDRRLSATGSVFAEERDESERDRTRAIGGEVSLLYERRQFQTLALSYRIEDRRVREFRFGSDTDGSFSFIDLTGDIAGLVSANRSSSVVAASATYGVLDDPLVPRRGFLVRPSAQVTLPFPATALDFGRLNATSTAYFPLGRRLTAFGRVGTGRLIPFRVETDNDPFIELYRLEEQTFRAGGTVDVRGWGTNQLGPKVLDLVFTPTPEPDDDPDDLGFTVSAGSYYRYGGTTRLTGTAELRMDFNELLGAFAFLDAGRIWTPERSLQPEDGSVLFDDTFGNTNRFFFGTGGGVSVASPIGAIQVGLGFKINPSFFDVRDPRELGRVLNEALQTDPDIETPGLIEAARTVEPSFWRRLHLHLAIGQTF